MPMKKTLMAPGIMFLEAEQQDSWQMNNGLLIYGEETIMIDGRFGKKETIDFIKENEVSRYFISHFHIDHSSGAWRIAAETKCRPALNALEHRYLQSSANMAEATGYGPAGVHQLVEELLMPKIDLRYIPDLGSYSLADIETISKGKLLAIPAPGHSPGHYCLYAPDNESLYVCDLGLDRFGPWYGFPHCNLRDFLLSLHTARQLGAKRLFSSHRAPVLEKTSAVIDRCKEIIEKRHEQILQAWHKGKRTLKEIAQEGIFYQKTDGLGKRAIPIVSYWQESMVKCHLEYAELQAEDA